MTVDLPTIREKVAIKVLAHLAGNGWRRTDLPNVDLDGFLVVSSPAEDAAAGFGSDLTIARVRDAAFFMAGYEPSEVANTQKVAEQPCARGCARVLLLEDEAPRLIDIEFGVGPS